MRTTLGKYDLYVPCNGLAWLDTLEQQGRKFCNQSRKPLGWLRFPFGYAVVDGGYPRAYVANWCRTLVANSYVDHGRNPSREDFLPRLNRCDCQILMLGFYAIDQMYFDGITSNGEQSLPQRDGIRPIFGPEVTHQVDD